MTVDTSLFADGFDVLPDWQCPTCGKGHLKQLAEHPIVNKETGPSSAAKAHDYWEPEWIERRFAGLLQCDFGNCGELVAILGDVYIQERETQDYQGEWSQEHVQVFHPRSLQPAPLPIRPPVDTPEDVAKLLKGAAGLLWQSPEAAGNQIRQAVEILLDEQGVANKLPNGGFKKLHNRLEEFQKTDPKNADILFAIKWLGNSGSHPGGLKRSDVLDAFNFIELVLVNLYDKTTDEIIAKAKAINLNKGPLTPIP